MSCNPECLHSGHGRAVPETEVSKILAKDFPDMPSVLPPEPLVRARPQGLPLPIAHLGPLRAPTEALATLTQAPPEIGFQSLLAVVSLAAQAHADVETLAGRTALSLFLLTVAASGERKSTCDKLATVSIRKWEEEQWTEYLQRREAYDAEFEVFERLRRKSIKERCGDEVIEGALPPASQPPIAPRKILSDMTWEGLLHHFEEGDPSIGIFSDEGGQLFGGHAMSRENMLKTGAGLSKLWDAAPLNRTRAGQALATFRHRRGALHVMLQAGVAEGVFANELLRDQGLLSRCLPAWPESRIGMRLIAEEGADDSKRAGAEEALTAFHARIRRLLARPTLVRDDPRELAPALLRLAPEARSKLVRFANVVERQQGDGKDLAHIRGFTSKAAEQTARIAGVLSLLGDAESGEVSPEVMVDAIAITAWYISEAQRALDSGSADPAMDQAEALRIWLLTSMPDVPFDKRTIVRRGPGAIRDTRTVERLLAVLEKHHWIIPCPNAVIDGRRAAQAWRLTPHV